MKNSVIHSTVSLKKLLLTALIIAISMYSSVKAQSYYFSDDFESYWPGERLACQNPNDWTTWNFLPCSLEDAFVSNNIAYSGSNSVVVSSLNDVVKYWEPGDRTFWEIDFDCYIPSGKSGYFSTLASFIGTHEWGMEVYFNNDGTAILNAGDTTFVFNFQFDTWIHNAVVVFLQYDEASYTYNGEFNYQWQWSLGANGTPIQLLVSANDFWGSSDSSEMYIDNYWVIADYYFPVEIISFSASSNSPGEVVLNWQTATEENNKGYEIQRSEVKGQKSEWQIVGFVEGNGTSTESHTYSITDKNVIPGKYNYRLKQIDFNGNYKYSKEISVSLNPAYEFSLEQNYPNPFNPTTTLNYQLPESGFVTLKVYDIIGKEIATLVNEQKNQGKYSVNFDASKLASGVYIYRIRVNDYVSSKKMILLK